MTRDGQLLREGHSPSLCAISGASLWTQGIAAGISGESTDHISTACQCTCRGCQEGKCGLNGTPPITERERVKAKAAFERSERKRWAKQRVFSTWDLPPDRTPESFRFTVDEVYDDYGDGHIGIEDTYLTDHADERDRLVGNILASFNDVRVTERTADSDDRVTWHRQPEEEPDA